MSSAEFSAGAERAYEKLSKQFALLIGDVGFRVLFERSLSAVRAKHAWLPPLDVPTTTGSPWAAIRRAMEGQPPAEASNAFVEIFSSFISLLRRLIGDGLVFRLMHEMWPDVFAAYGTTENP